MLVKYVRNRRREPIGCVVALDREKIGFSKVHSRLDRFNREMGIEIAKGQAESGFKCEIPHSVRRDFEEMRERAQRYYK